MIFDMDDTLVHSRIDFQALSQWFIKELQKRNISPPLGEDLAQMSVSQMLQLAEAHDERAGTYHGLELWQKVEEAEMEGARRATVEADAQAVLAELKGRDFVLSIFTNNSSLVANKVLDRFSLDKYIDTVITRDEAKALKPDPTGLLMLKKRYQQQVKEMFFIGDSWIDGIAANRAQIPFIGFNCHEPRGVEMLHNVFSLPDLARLLEEVCL